MTLCNDPGGAVAIGHDINMACHGHVTSIAARAAEVAVFARAACRVPLSTVPAITCSAEQLYARSIVAVGRNRPGSSDRNITPASAVTTIFTCGMRSTIASLTACSADTFGKNSQCAQTACFDRAVP